MKPDLSLWIEAEVKRIDCPQFRPKVQSLLNFLGHLDSILDEAVEKKITSETAAFSVMDEAKAFAASVLVPNLSDLPSPQIAQEEEVAAADASETEPVVTDENNSAGETPVT